MPGSVSGGATGLAKDSFTIDDFIEAVADDMRRPKYFSTDHPMFEDTKSIEDAEAEFYAAKAEREKTDAGLAGLTDEEFYGQKTIADFVSDEDVKQILLNSEKQGSISAKDRDELIQIGVYEKQLNKEDVENHITNLEREFATRQAERQTPAPSQPGIDREDAPIDNRDNQDASPAESGFYQPAADQISVPDPEIDESDISDDEDVDLSFDFADEETAPVKADEATPAKTFPDIPLEQKETATAFFNVYFGYKPKGNSYRTLAAKRDWSNKLYNFLSPESVQNQIQEFERLLANPSEINESRFYSADQLLSNHEKNLKNLKSNQERALEVREKYEEAIKTKLLPDDFLRRADRATQAAKSFQKFLTESNTPKSADLFVNEETPAPAKKPQSSDDKNLSFDRIDESKLEKSGELPRFYVLRTSGGFDVIDSTRKRSYQEVKQQPNINSLQDAELFVKSLRSGQTEPQYYREQPGEKEKRNGTDENLTVQHKGQRFTKDNREYEVVAIAYYEDNLRLFADPISELTNKKLDSPTYFNFDAVKNLLNKPEAPKPQTSFDQTDLFGNKVSAKTEQVDLFGDSNAAAESEANLKQETADAYGKKTADYLSQLEKSTDKDISRAAQSLIDARKLVAAKGETAKQLVEDASDALDLFTVARHQQTTVKEQLSQRRLDTADYSAQAVEFAKFMEAGKFASVFGIALSEAKTESGSVRLKHAEPDAEEINPNIGFPANQIRVEQRNFAKDVDSVLSGTAKRGYTPEIISSVPPLLQKLGLIDAEIKIPQSVIRKAVGTDTLAHDIDADVLKQLPFELNNPVMVFDSLSDDNAIVVLTTLSNRKGFPVVAVINRKGDIGGEIVNVVPSVHEKDKLRFVTDWARQNKLRYINQEKSQQWFQKVGVQFSETETELLASPNILTEADFVKNQPLKRAEGESTQKEFHEIKFAPADELVQKATVERNRDRVKVNLEGQEFIRRVMEEIDIRAGRKKIGDDAVETSFSGLFSDNPSTLKLEKTLRDISDEATKAGNRAAAEFATKLANEIEAASKKGKGTAVLYMYDSRLPHEVFHQASYLGDLARNLITRHANFGKLKAHPVFKATADYFRGFSEYSEIERTNPKMFDALVAEESAAYIAGGERTLLGVSKEDAADYLNTWFDSYAAKNGIESLDKFEQIEGVTYDAIQRIRQARAAEAVEADTGRETKSDVGRGENLSSEPEQIAGGEATRDGRTSGKRGTTSQSGQRNQRLRSLPQSLREAGLDAENLLYDIQTDTEAKTDAAEMLEKLGIAGAIDLIDNLPNPDASHANLAFMVSQVLQSKAAELEKTNPQEATQIRALQADFTRDLATKFTKAGQFISAARVIQNNAQAVVGTAESIIAARGNTGETLSPADRDKFNTLGEQNELAIAKVTELQRRLRNEQAKNKRLNDSIEGKTKRRTKNSQVARVQVAQLARQKHGAAVDSLIENLRRQFGMNSPLLKRIEDIWHGSPHVFDKFSLSAIGTGEGAQVYGHGLYFTDREEIADFYKDGLSKRNRGNSLTDYQDGLRVGNKKGSDYKVSMSRDLIDAAVAGEKNKVLAIANEQVISWRNLSKDKTYSFRDYAKEQAQIYKQFAKDVFDNGINHAATGAKYKVTLAPDADEFLLWDKPLSEQSEKVKKAFTQLYKDFPMAGGFTRSDISGRALYESLQGEIWNKTGERTGIEKAASEALKDAGVRGIKYLDGTSRSKGEGSFNYVVFDDADVEINQILKRIEDDGGLDQQTIDQIAQVGALQLIEGLSKKDADYTPDQFRAAMIGLFGDTLRNQIDEIHKESLNVRAKWLADIAFEKRKTSLQNKAGSDEGRVALEQEIGRRLAEDELSDEDVYEILNTRRDVKRKRNAVERMHGLVSGFTKRTATSGELEKLDKQEKGVEFSQNELDSTIVELAGNEYEAAAARILADGAGMIEFYGKFKKLGVPALEARKLFTTGAVLLKDAKEKIRQNHTEILEEAATSTALITDIADDLWKARTDAKNKAKEVSDELQKLSQSKSRYALSKVVDASNALRTLMASFDLSAGLRQGGYFSAGFPGMQAGNVRDMLRSFGMQGYGRVIQEIESAPKFWQSQRAGLEMAEAGSSADFTKEEVFKGDEMLKNIPFLGKVLDKAVLGWSERTYNAFLDAQRIMMYSRFAGELEAANLTFKNNPNEFKAIAEFINIATGKGAIPKNKLGKLLVDLPFFAPRYTLSRFQLLNKTLNPVAYYNMPPETRKIVAKSAVRFYGTIGLLTTLAGMFGLASFDDDDSDFLKVKVGETRYDMFAGLLPTAKLIIKFVHSAIRTKGGQANRVPGEFGDDILQAGGRFFRGKLSPAMSFGWDAASGAEYNGQPFTWQKGIVSRLVPLTMSDMYEAYQVDGARGMALTLPAIVGLGVQTFKPRDEKPRTEAEKLARKLSVATFKGKPQTEESQKNREIKSNLTFRSRKGENVLADANAALAAGQITDKQKTDILAAKKKTYLQDLAETLPKESLDKVYEYATPDEKAQLDPMMAKKQKAVTEKLLKSANPPDLADKLKRADTDSAVELFTTREENLTDAQKKLFRGTIKAKADNAARRGTLTGEELETVRKVLPDYKMPFVPKRFPRAKRPDKLAMLRGVQ